MVGSERLALSPLGLKDPCCRYLSYNPIKLIALKSLLSVLDFHHPDNNKEHEISRSNNENAANEAKKCILVCSNCHRAIHSGLLSI